MGQGKVVASSSLGAYLQRRSTPVNIIEFEKGDFAQAQSQPCEQTSNLPFQEWTTVFASERLTGALLDRITHHVHILEMNADSYRLMQSRSRRRQPSE